jgi:type I restriction enzyme, S subunit
VNDFRSSLLPKKWLWVEVNQIAEAITGNTPPTSNQANYGGAIPFVKPPQLVDSSISNAPETLTEIGSKKARILPVGAVLVSCIGNLGKTAIAKVPCATNQQINALVFAAPIPPEYGFYYAQTLGAWLNSAASATTISIVNKGKFETAPFPLAPLAEQTRIVEKLEELLSDLDAGVAELKAAQKKLGQYRQSLLKAAVEGALTADWRKSQKTKPAESGAQLLKRILHERRTRWEAKQLAKFKEQGKTPVKGWQSKYVEPVAPETAGLPELPKGWVWASLDMLSVIQGGIQKQPSRIPTINKYPFLRVANVARGLLKLDDVHEIELFAGELERLTLLKGDVLIVEGNGSLSEIGRCALWDGSIENAVHQNHLIRARPIVMLSEFVESWLNSLRAIEKLTKLAATTSGLYTLSVGKISKIPVPVPPMDEQVAVMAMLASALEGQRYQDEAIKGSLKQATAQRKNILKAAFSGQLVPQDPQDEPASVLLARIRQQRAEREKEPKASKTRSKTNKKLKV